MKSLLYSIVLLSFIGMATGCQGGPGGLLGGNSACDDGCGGGCGPGGCGLLGGGLGGGGCGPGGCGIGNGPLASALQNGGGQPVGTAAGGVLANLHGPSFQGSQSHNGPSPGPAYGPASPTVTYPYYTTRGPRDYFVDNPPSIGR